MTSAFDTLPGMLEVVHSQYRNSKALNFRHLGQWEPVSTEEMVETVRRLALGLKSIGLKEADTVGIIMPSSPQWLMTDLAVLSNRGVSVPMFHNISPDNFRFEVNDAEIKYLFIDSPRLLPKEIQTELKKFRHVVCLSVDDRDNNFIHFDELLKKGDGWSASHPEDYVEMLASLSPDDLATIIYTSGSTGVPKGVELTHYNLVTQIRGADERFPLYADSDVVLSFLPLAHVFERMVMYFYVSSGVPVYFADDVKKTGDYMREIHPTIITVVPRLLEKVYAKMKAGASEKKGLAKHLAMRSVHLAERTEPDAFHFMRMVAEKTVFGKLRAAMGGKLRLVISGSAKLSPNLHRFFANLKVPVFEGYGLTECSPVLAANYPGFNKRGSVGPAFPGVELKIAEDGEILGKSPGVTRGYHKNPSATKELIDEEGWLHTGDLGSMDSDGFLTITGRKKEMLKTSVGKFVSPVPIEQDLTLHEIIDMAVVIAEGKNFATALLFPDYENMAKVKAKVGYADMDNKSFLELPETVRRIEKHLLKVNKKRNHWETIRKWRLVQHPISPETGELTPTMKIRRHVVEEKFKDLIDELYQE